LIKAITTREKERGKVVVFVWEFRCTLGCSCFLATFDLVVRDTGKHHGIYHFVTSFYLQRLSSNKFTPSANFSRNLALLSCWDLLGHALCKQNSRLWFHEQRDAKVNLELVSIEQSRQGLQELTAFLLIT